MITTKLPTIVISIFLLLLAQNTLAQTPQPALEAHLQKAVKSLAERNFELWKTLFPNREETILLYNHYEESEWKTPETDNYLRGLEEDLAYIKVERFYTKTFLEALQSGMEMHSGNMEPVAAYDWSDMQIEQFDFDTPQSETEFRNTPEWSGYVLFNNKKDKKQYIIRFTDVIAFQQKFWGVEFHDMEELKEPLEEYLKVETLGEPTVAIVDEAVAAAIDTLAGPTYAPKVALTESEYTGKVGNKKITIYWTDIETEDGSRTEVTYKYATNPNYNYFSTEDLQNHNFILTEPDGAAFWHIHRVKKSITGIRVLPDGSVQEKVVLNLKSNGKQVYKE